MTHPIVVAAPILARNSSEAARLLDAIEVLSSLGLPVVLADGGSEPGFVQRLRRLPNIDVVLPDATAEQHAAPRLVGQVRRAFAAAHEWLGPNSSGGRVLYTEPDKGWFFANRLARFLDRAQQHEPAVKAGVVVAARNASSFATFPPFQQTTEALLNQLCAATWDKPGDYVYGPLSIRSDLLPYLNTAPADLGWGWRIHMMAVSHRLGRGIVTLSDDLPCPPEQRGENDERARIYRMEQLAQNVRGLALGMKHPLDDPELL